MSESTVRMKIGNCERWRQWASALVGRGAISRRRSPLTLEWLRRFGIRPSRLHFVRGGPLSQQFHAHLSMPFSVQFHPTLARTVYVGANTTYVRTPAEAIGVADAAVRYARLEQSSSSAVEVHSSEFLRVALERTRRVEHRVATRELVLARAPGVRTRGSSEEDTHAPAHWALETSRASDYTRLPAAPAVNVDQIADTVMRQLDRRIGSWRERMGRL